MTATASTPTYRYRYGGTEPVAAPYKSGLTVNTGDLVYIDSGDSYTVKPANALTWSTSLAPTQGVFVASFLGVAAQTYNSSQTNTVGIGDGNLRVDTAGVFDFDTAASSFNVGDLVGPDKDTGNNLLNQQVALVSSEADAIGRVVSNVLTVVNGVNRVRVAIFGTKARVSN
jgi:hypothetical protein